MWLFDAASGSVKAQPVVVATADGNQAVIASGLKGGEQVVVAGVHVLTDGQKVNLFNEKKMCLRRFLVQIRWQPKLKINRLWWHLHPRKVSHESGGRAKPQTGFQPVALGAGACRADALPDGGADVVGHCRLLSAGAG